MNTKSKIQLINESIALRNEFKNTLSELMGKYNIEDAIFTMREGRVVEAVDGYFVVNNEYKDLNEAISNAIGKAKGLRIMNNETFIVGDIYEMLSMCPENSKVLDIKKLENLD